jgi:hypothetical protein
MPRRQPTILQDSFELLGPTAIDNFVSKLNGEGEESRELRRLAMRWKASGPNLRRMLSADTSLWKHIQEALRGFWVPSDHARAYLVPSSSGTSSDFNPTPVRNARFAFGVFVLHPDCDLVGGPCDICRKWFKQDTRHFTRFCTKKCASLAAAPAAIQTTREKREKAHKKRIRWAQEAMTIWSSKPRIEGWKSWVLRYVNRQSSNDAKENRQPEPCPITEKWLTRYINNDQLHDPTAKSKKRRSKK